MILVGRGTNQLVGNREDAPSATVAPCPGGPNAWRTRGWTPERPWPGAPRWTGRESDSTVTFTPHGQHRPIGARKP